MDLAAESPQWTELDVASGIVNAYSGTIAEYLGNYYVTLFEAGILAPVRYRLVDATDWSGNLLQ